MITDSLFIYYHLILSITFPFTANFVFLLTGKTFAEELGCPFVELSTSEDVTDVTEAFHSLCRDIVEYKRRSRTFFGRVFGAFGREKVSS